MTRWEQGAEAANFSRKESKMLVLGREVGGRIQVGDDITITLVRASAGEARIGIDAPPEMNIVRTELLRTPKPGEER